MNYTQEENLLIQSYFTTAFLTELTNNNFLKSDYYKNMQFQDSYIKEKLPTIGIDNQGALIIFLYSSLVIPKELIENQFPAEFANLNTVLDNIKSSATSTYKKDAVKIDYLRHVRNAVAHANVEFDLNGSVIFNDKNDRGENCSITIPLNLIGSFLTELQKIFVAYVKTLKLKYQ